jgi:predicted RNA binding protein
MKHSEEYNRFTNLVDRLMSVSHEEMQRREAEYRKQAEANPRRRGPKPGTKRKRKAVMPPSADHEATET